MVLGRTSYAMPQAVATEYRKIDAYAGCAGNLDEARWPSSERNVYPVKAGETHQNVRLHGGTFVGVWSSSYGPPVDDLMLSNMLIDGSTMWAARPYNWRDRITWRKVTVRGVEIEHGLYPTMIGRGTYSDEEVRPSNGTPSLTLDGCRWEYIGSQALQLTGPRHLYGQTVGTAPNGTHFPMEQADTNGGPIMVHDNFARMVCSWGKRPAFTYQFREAKQHVVIDGLVLDNTWQVGGEGGVLFEGAVSAIHPDPSRRLPWFPRHVDARRMIVLEAGGNRTPVQADHITTLRGINWAIYHENQVPIRLNRTASHPGRIVLDQCFGNVRVRIDGDDAGPLEGQRIEVAW